MLTLLTSPAFAQQAMPDGRTAFDITYFERFAPTNALDIASNVPGFTLEDGQIVRGFSGAAGNLVINGNRPSGKSQSLSEFLRGIPSSQVARVELMPGQLAGAEYRSRANVLNIVLIDTPTSLTGAAEVALQVPPNGDLTPSANASGLYRRGDFTFSGGLTYSGSRFPDSGYDILTASPSGALIERRDRANEYFREDLALTSSTSWEPQDELSGHLNIRVGSWDQSLQHESRVTNLGGLLRNDSIENETSFRDAEVGGDLSLPMHGGTVKLIMLLRGEETQIDETLGRRDPNDAFLGGIALASESLATERIARLSWAKNDLGAWTFEASAEAAYNALDVELDLFQLDSSGGATPIVLPSSTVLVEETRQELALSGSRAFSETLSFNAGLAIEHSLISVSGDAPSERSLTFVKPSLALEWRPDPNLRVRASLQRTVAQLDFSDFASSAELANSRFNSGNPDLEPERSWRYSILAERRFWDDGLVRLTLGYDQVEAVQDRVPTDVGLDAPGNLGDGERLWIETSLNLPLDRMGIPGGRLNTTWNLQSSNVPDPYTRSEREFSEELPWQFYLSFRQDRAQQNWAWGFDYVNHGEIIAYRLDEIDSLWPGDQFANAYIELRPASGTTLTLTASDVLDNGIMRDRTFFTPDRSAAAPFAHEERVRHRGRTFTLTLRRQFA